jgi:hypothetical protein
MSNNNNNGNPQLSLWKSFLDHYDTIAVNILKLFTHLSETIELQQQRILAEQIEEQIFLGKNVILSMEEQLNLNFFTYNMRDLAQSQLNNYKEGLESHFRLLYVYQKSHSQGKAIDIRMYQTFNEDMESDNPNIMNDERKNNNSLMIDTNHRNVDEIQLTNMDHGTYSYRSPFSDNINLPVNLGLDISPPYSAADYDDDANYNQKSPLLPTNNINTRMMSSMDRSMRSLDYTHKYSADAIDSLQQQREILTRQRNTVQESGRFAHGTGRLLSQWSHRLGNDICLQSIVIMIEIVVFVIVAWVKYFR